MVAAVSDVCEWVVLQSREHHPFFTVCFVPAQLIPQSLIHSCLSTQCVHHKLVHCEVYPLHLGTHCRCSTTCFWWVDSTQQSADMFPVVAIHCKPVCICDYSMVKSAIRNFLFFKVYFLPLLIVQLKRWQETGWEGGTRSKGPQTGTQTHIHRIWDTHTTSWAERCLH